VTAMSSCQVVGAPYGGVKLSHPY